MLLLIKIITNNKNKACHCSQLAAMAGAVNLLLVSPVAFARAFNLATPINLLTHYAKGTPSF